ncbi:MAG TPA: SLC13 family permease [Anaerolineae bacterium]|nr:SLC13 family permease [Anaerolineae bacterium]
MTDQALITLLLLTVAIILMVTEWLRADLVALLLALGLVVAGVITLQEAFSGFSRPAVITILAIFILTQGLYRTGVTQRIGDGLYWLTRGRPTRLLLLTMVIGASLSLFMNNLAAAALLMPAVMDAARRSHTNPSRLLMPLAFAVILGGAATLLTTSNILASAVLRDQGLTPFGLLDFLPVGLPMLTVGVSYLLFAGRRLLPAINTVEHFADAPGTPNGLAEIYALDERLSEVEIPPDSPLAGKSLAASQIGERFGLSILAIRREGQPLQLAPGPEQVVRAGDSLLVAGQPERVRQLTEMGGRLIHANAGTPGLATEEVTLLEVIPAPHGAAVGRTLKELRFREKYGLSVVALWRSGRPYRTDVGDMPLQFGDALLVHGLRERAALLHSDPDFIVLTEPEVPPRARKGWLAVMIMTVTLLAAAFNLMPVAEAMMLGALGMILTGCLTMDEAYQAIEWRSIFLIAGMLPASIALTQSGATQWLGQLAVAALAKGGPMALAGGLFLLATALTQVLSGQVAAVVVTPVAIAAAQQIGADPRAVAMAAALGCSMAFMTPTSHPVNLFVMGPGGYRFRDFLRVGLPLTLLELAVVMLVLPIFWPLR